VPADGHWATYSFGVLPAELTGSSPGTILGSVEVLRIEHNPSGSHPPPLLTTSHRLCSLIGESCPFSA